MKAIGATCAFQLSLRESSHTSQASHAQEPLTPNKEKEDRKKWNKKLELEVCPKAQGLRDGFALWVAADNGSMQQTHAAISAACSVCMS